MVSERREVNLQWCAVMSLQFTKLKEGKRLSPLLNIKNLSVRVGIRQVLKEMNLTVYPGDHVRITGPNGSGKSTLLNAIAGVEPARIEEGTIEFNGNNITRLAPHERTSVGIAYMRQSDNVFPSLSVADNLRLALGGGGPESFTESFPEWANDIPLIKIAGNLSGGQKKKLAWGMTLLRQNVRLALLDEPKAGMDCSIETKNIFEDMTVLEIEHS